MKRMRTIQPGRGVSRRTPLRSRTVQGVFSWKRKAGDTVRALAAIRRDLEGAAVEAEEGGDVRSALAFGEAATRLGQAQQRLITIR